MKVEYLHTNFGTVSKNGTLTGPGVFGVFATKNPFRHRADLSATIGRIGINERF